jgi:hypothetical protein
MVPFWSDPQPDSEHLEERNHESIEWCSSLDYLPIRFAHTITKHFPRRIHAIEYSFHKIVTLISGVFMSQGYNFDSPIRPELDRDTTARTTRPLSYLAMANKTVRLISTGINK